jgi:ATPase family associated with various cellular activities (AAA)
MRTPAELTGGSTPQTPQCHPGTAFFFQDNRRLVVPDIDRLCVQAVRAFGVRVGVLLHGPEGSGRGTAVAAAAASLGIHVVEFSCLELRGASEAKTDAALDAAFDSAALFAPAVLFLRDLECVWEL